MTKTIGEFTLKIYTDGSPASITILNGGGAIRFTSSSLPDLKHALSEAVRLIEAKDD